MTHITEAKPKCSPCNILSLSECFSPWRRADYSVGPSFSTSAVYWPLIMKKRAVLDKFSQNLPPAEVQHCTIHIFRKKRKWPCGWGGVLSSHWQGWWIDAVNLKSLSYHSNTACDHHHKDIFATAHSWEWKKDGCCGGSSGLVGLGGGGSAGAEDGKDQRKGKLTQRKKAISSCWNLLLMRPQSAPHSDGASELQDVFD